MSGSTILRLPFLGLNSLSKILDEAGEAAVLGLNPNPIGAGLTGINGAGQAKGIPEGLGVGAYGQSDIGFGVVGFSSANDGVFGISTVSFGIHGRHGDGVGGGVDIRAGVVGESHAGNGVVGVTNGSGMAGVVGMARSSAGAGVVGESEQYDGVFGISHQPDRAGVSGRSINADGTVNKDGLAGFFDGKVVVTNDIILSNADCAEDFDISGVANVESGTVMTIDDCGALRASSQPYDKKVAGVVSGAGGYKPGLLLDRQQTQVGRKPIALLGKVYCKVDAQYGSLEVGDLLTTSPTIGHAMKAADPFRAFGAVIGKALRPLEAGQGLIPILVALQ